MENLRKETAGSRKLAMTAGLALILMAAAASYSYGMVHGDLVVTGDPGATFRNLVTSHRRFQMELAGWLFILVADMVVAWALYRYWLPVNPPLAKLGAWLRLLYTAFLGMALHSLLQVSLLTSGSDYLSSLPEEALPAAAMLGLDTFEAIWSVGLILFGGHLMVISRLAWQSPGAGRFISVLLGVASAGYLAVHLGRVVLATDSRILSILEFVFTGPMAAGELGLAVWLLFKGRSRT
ncbi:DUF4386 domain-containing protein [Paenibacillus sp. CC-CFT747]|nr:DUF4386 domain-containing protein [Paenibacillus sp. CC-CFT747]